MTTLTKGDKVVPKDYPHSEPSSVTYVNEDADYCELLTAGGWHVRRSISDYMRAE